MNIRMNEILRRQPSRRRTAGSRQVRRLKPQLVPLEGRALLTVTTVPGTGDPWLAGMPAGSKASTFDVAPAQSPVQVLGLSLTAGAMLKFTSSGSVTIDPSYPSYPPDGIPDWIIRHFDI